MIITRNEIKGKRRQKRRRKLKMSHITPENPAT